MLPFAHIGLIVVKSAAKPLVELALEYYVSSLVKKDNKYSAYQIDAICENNKVVSGDTYAAKLKGYYTLEETIKKLESANSDLAKQIKDTAYKLHEEDDFLIIEHDQN